MSTVRYYYCCKSQLPPLLLRTQSREAEARQEAVLSVTASPCLRRLVELSSSVPIGSHWGVLSKCLAYSKAASDPFVYSLLRHQYRKSCKEILNRILHRRSLHSSGLTGDSHSQNILPVSE